MASVLEVITIINQIVSDTYDGSKLGEEFTSELGAPLSDSCLAYAISVKFFGTNKMRMSYTTQVDVRDVDVNFESGLSSIFSEMIKLIKKNYSSRDFGSVSFSTLGELKARVEPAYNKLALLIAHQDFEINNISVEESINIASRNLRAMLRNGK